VITSVLAPKEQRHADAFSPSLPQTPVVRVQTQVLVQAQPLGPSSQPSAGSGPDLAAADAAEEPATRVHAAHHPVAAEAVPSGAQAARELHELRAGLAKLEQWLLVAEQGGQCVDKARVTLSLVCRGLAAIERCGIGTVA